MSSEQPRPINVFISYSWTTLDHEEWVLNLARRLDEFNNIHVILDKWDLQTGNDVIAFMERMVKEDALVDKVLIICDHKYVKRANDREKGVGIETQIISSEVYKEVNQTKFIPVVRERNDDGDAYLPTFLKGRLYEDFSNDNQFEESFEKLLRTITGHPYHARPAKKGPLPVYITDQAIPRYKTAQIAIGIDSILSTRPQQLKFKIREFLEEMVNVLGGKSIDITDPSVMAVGKQLYDEVESLTPFRDDFLTFFDKVIRSGNEFDVDELVVFFSQIHKFTYELPHTGPSYDAQYDSRKFLVIELFLSFVGLCLKHGLYTQVGGLLHSTYQIHQSFDWVIDKDYTFKKLYNYPHYLDEYYKKLHNKDFYSPIGALLSDRVSSLVTQPYLLTADLLCAVVGSTKGASPNWYALTHPYFRQANFDIFTRVKSGRFFEKVKEIYGVQTPQELAQVFQLLLDKPMDSLQSYRSGIALRNILRPEAIATER